MKIRSLLFPLLLADTALVFVRCKNSEQDSPAAGRQGKTVTIVASLEQPVPTKTSLTSARQVLWSAGDKIRVYNASNPDGVVFTLDAATAGTSKGQFTGEQPSGSGPFYAVYPAEAGGKLSGSSIAVTLPAHQSYVEGSFGSGAAVSMAKGESLSNLLFKNVLGGVSFSLSGTKSLSGVRLQTKGAEALSGAGTVSMSGDSPVLEMNARTSDEGSYLFLDGPAAASASFCLMLPPGAFEQGFLVEFLDAEGNVMFRSAKASVNTVTRSSIVAMPASAYEPAYKAAFFTSDTFGYFPSIGASAALDASKAYVPGTCQYAYKDASASRYVRVQSLSQGFYTEITTPKTLNLGETCEVTLSVLTGNAKTTQTQNFTVLQKTGDRVWLVNESQKTGIIQMMED